MKFFGLTRSCFTIKRVRVRYPNREYSTRIGAETTFKKKSYIKTLSNPGIVFDKTAGSPILENPSEINEKIM